MLNAYAQPVLADTGNGVVRELAADNALYTLALLSSPRATQVSVTTPDVIYGAAQAMAHVSGTSAVPQGTVTVRENGSVLASVSLASGAATVELLQLPAGAHTLNVAYSGDGLNAASNSAVAVGIMQAASATTLAPVSATYAGLSVLLSAHVSSSTSGVPSGAVDFLEGGNTIGSAVLLNGYASASIAAPAQGTHTLTASYRGDANFSASVSAAVSATVAAMPDFALSVGSATVSVQGGSAAVLPMQVSPQGGAFTGVVSLSVAGLPPGATASFAPSSLVPGAYPASSTLTVQTVARTAAVHRRPDTLAYAGFSSLVLLVSGAMRRRRRFLASLVAFTFCCLASLGCGTRTTGSATTASAQTYNVTITGTGTNLAGATVTHSTAAVLTVF